MTQLTLVAPLHPQLFSRLSGKTVIFGVDHPGQVLEAQRIAGDYSIQLRCVWVRSDQALSELGLDGGWGSIPVALQAQSLGRFRDLLLLREALSSSNVRIYLPAETQSGCTEVRILSSLGFHCCAVLDYDSSRAIDWKALRDLAVYSIYCRRSHGDIDPFSYLTEHYDRKALVSFRSVYFDDPAKFLQVDQEGRLSLSREDQRNGLFLDLRVEECESVPGSIAHLDALERWKSFFVERTRCAECEGWQLCGGAFSTLRSFDDCSEAFKEILEGAEHLVGSREGIKRTWRL